MRGFPCSTDFYLAIDIFDFIFKNLDFFFIFLISSLGMPN